MHAISPPQRRPLSCRKRGRHAPHVGSLSVLAERRTRPQTGFVGVGFEKHVDEMEPGKFGWIDPHYGAVVRARSARVEAMLQRASLLP